MDDDDLRLHAKQLVRIRDNGGCSSFVVGFIQAAGDLAERWLADHPEDDAEKITPEWVCSVLPNTSSYGRRGDHKGKLGEVSWLTSKHETSAGSFCMWLNGSLYDWPEATRGELRRLCQAMRIELKEGS